MPPVMTYLEKLAISWSNLRSMVEDAKRRGVDITRRNYPGHHDAYNSFTNTINIERRPRSKKNGPRLPVGNIFAHEYGHALHADKLRKKLKNEKYLKKKLQFRKYIVNNYEPEDHKRHLVSDLFSEESNARKDQHSSDLKAERIANRNALSHIRTKADREDYKKDVAKWYGTYRHSVRKDKYTYSPDDEWSPNKPLPTSDAANLKKTLKKKPWAI